MKIDKLSIDGKKTSIEVKDNIFSSKINETLISQVIYKTNANLKRCSNVTTCHGSHCFFFFFFPPLTFTTIHFFDAQGYLTQSFLIVPCLLPLPSSSPPPPNTATRTTLTHSRDMFSLKTWTVSPAITRTKTRNSTRGILQLRLQFNYPDEFGAEKSFKGSSPSHEGATKLTERCRATCI